MRSYIVMDLSTFAAQSICTYSTYHTYDCPPSMALSWPYLPAQLAAVAVTG